MKFLKDYNPKQFCLGLFVEKKQINGKIMHNKLLKLKNK
jgi:hypothetical protein